MQTWLEKSTSASLSPRYKRRHPCGLVPVTGQRGAGIQTVWQRLLVKVSFSGCSLGMPLDTLAMNFRGAEPHTRVRNPFHSGFRTSGEESSLSVAAFTRLGFRS